MRAIRSCVIAFSMYSSIPVPTLRWEKRDMEYVFCFFPLIGVACALLTLLWLALSRFLSLGGLLTAAGCTLLPALVTGGIHIDGFCDTTDALASRQSRERKLEILKDSNVGAFAVIGCICYFLLYFALWYQALSDGLSVLIPGAVFILSRALSGLAAVTRKNARGSGLLAAFTDAVTGRAVKIVIAAWLALCAALLLWLDVVIGLAVLAAAGLVYAYYYLMSERSFGGITGDLAGWFLSVCELACLFAAVLAGRVVRL